MAKGGLTKGKSHAEGGIKMKVKSTGQNIEVEGGEVIVNKKNVSDPTKLEFEGEQKTTCEILSDLNSRNDNGVTLECDSVEGKKYKHKEGGKLPSKTTYKQKFNKKYGFPKDESHSLSEVSKLTGVSKKGIKQIYEKGEGAFYNNPSSVRKNVKSPQQWAMSRVYSSVMGGKASKVDAKELKMEKGGILNNPNFKSWFGDSKVVDENGNPLVVYHGTDNQFNTFNKSTIGDNHWESKSDAYGGGFFFTDKKHKAFRKNYIMEVYLKIENPYLIKLEDKYGYEVDYYNATDKIDINPDRYFQTAKENGNDGIIITTPRGSLYVVFEPTQIKSAIGNSGEYDTNNPSIIMEKGGTIKMAKDLTKKDIEYLSEVIDSQYIPDKWKQKASEMVEETKSESKKQPSSKKSNEKFDIFKNIGKYYDETGSYYTRKEIDEIEKKYGLNSQKYSAITLPKNFNWKNADRVDATDPFYLESNGNELLTKRGLSKEKYGLSMDSAFGNNSKPLVDAYALDDEGYFQLLYIYERNLKTQPSSEKQQLERALKGIEVAIDIAGETKELMKAKKGVEMAINLISKPKDDLGFIGISLYENSPSLNNYDIVKETEKAYQIENKKGKKMFIPKSALKLSKYSYGENKSYEVKKWFRQKLENWQLSFLQSEQ